MQLFNFLSITSSHSSEKPEKIKIRKIKDFATDGVYYGERFSHITITLKSNPTIYLFMLISLLS